MQKLGLGFLVTGVLGQLSALSWTTIPIEPTCQNSVENSFIQQKVAAFEQLLDGSAKKVATAVITTLSDELAPLAHNGSRILDSAKSAPFKFLENTPEELPVLSAASLPTQAHSWTIVLCGLMTLGGLLLALFARKKTIAPQWHVFRTVPGSLVTLERSCLTCGGFFFLTKTRPLNSVPSGLWVVEIALNTPTRHRAIKAIQQLELPVARKENNFVVIGPYKQKQDAARVVKELSESHGVRGWVMAGN